MKIHCAKGPGIFWVAWGIVVAVVACAASAVNYTVVDQGVSSGKQFPSLHFEIINEKPTFEKLFAEIHSGRLPQPLRPKINFRTSLVDAENKVIQSLPIP